MVVVVVVVEVVVSADLGTFGPDFELDHTPLCAHRGLAHD